MWLIFDYTLSYSFLRGLFQRKLDFPAPELLLPIEQFIIFTAQGPRRIRDVVPSDEAA